MTHRYSGADYWPMTKAYSATCWCGYTTPQYAALEDAKADVKAHLLAKAGDRRNVLEGLEEKG